MVRKVDELGRVVIPKEMRRILNIKTGSSIEMSINSANQVVLKKFSELANILSMADALVGVVFDTFSVPCFLCDDESVLCLRGLAKKEFFEKKVNSINLSQNNCQCILVSSIVCGLQSDENCTPFKISSEGFEIGYLVLIHNSEIEKSVKSSIELLLKLFSNLASF